MNEAKKNELITKKFTFEGHPCNVAGTKMPWATISAKFPGYWHASWETVEKVAGRDSNFTATDVTLASWKWLGVGVELPEALKKYAL